MQGTGAREMDAGVDPGALSLWMDGEGLGAGPIEDAVRLGGGSQNILLQFRRAGRTYVLRRPPEHPRRRSNETMQREARVLSALAGTPVPHPAIIAVCTDESVLGAVFYLMEPVDGFNPAGGLPALHAGSAALRHRMGLAAVEALVTLANVDYRAVGLADFGTPEGFLERQVPRWRGQLAGYAQNAGWPGPQDLGDLGAVAGWLERRRPTAFRAGILHGDYHLANIMFQPRSGEVAAIVDWELATIGDPRIDLGWLLAAWPAEGDAPFMNIHPWDGFPTQRELLRHYRKCTGEAGFSTDFDAEWYAVLACYKLAIILEGTFARACAGKAPRATGDRLHGRAQWLIGRATRWIAQGAPFAGEAA